MFSFWSVFEVFSTAPKSDKSLMDYVVVLNIYNFICKKSMDSFICLSLLK